MTTRHTHKQHNQRSHRPTFISARVQKNYEEILPMIRNFETNYGMDTNDISNYDKTKNDKTHSYGKFNHSILSRVSRESPPKDTTLNLKKRTAIDDHVSKNISMLLESLLQSYENSQIPTHGQGTYNFSRENLIFNKIIKYQAFPLSSKQTS